MKRTGGQALSLLSSPLNVHILKALEGGPKGLVDLRRAVGSPPQSTMRVYAKTLSELGILVRRRQNEFPTTVDYEVTPAGSALVGVGEVLQQWLLASPDGPILLGSVAAKSATKALVEGWSTNVVRALAARPLSLTELNRLIPKISYPSLERRLGALRLAGLAEPQPGDGRGTPYGVTEWLRRAVVPLTSASNWERRFVAESTATVGRLDVECAFLLAVPLMALGPDVSGKCRLAVEIQGGSAPVFAGVVVCVEQGRVVSCTSRLEGESQAWASGTAAAWLRQMNGRDGRQLEIGGDARLAEAITAALRATAAGKSVGGSRA